MDVQQTGIITLLKSALTGKGFPLPKEFDIEKAEKTANKHRITSLLYYGALNCGIDEASPVMQKMFFNTCRQVSVNEQQKFVLSELLKEFEKNSVCYMLLKGANLKRIYPKPEMRPMGDIDILIKTEQYDTIKLIMESLDYKEVVESDHEFVWDKRGVHIELHKCLIPSYNKDYYAYFGDGWRLAHPAYDASYHTMTPEDEFIYLFTHFAKHYRDAGIGIRHIVDLWVFTRSRKLDNRHLKAELEKLQLYVFYQNIMHTLSVWFDGEPEDETDEFITNIIFNSGVYGTYEAHLLSSALKTLKNEGSHKKARFKRILNLVFLSYDRMCVRYPLLCKAAVLLPFFWIARWFDVLFFKTERIKRNTKELKITTTEKVDEYQKALNFVGLDYNFKE